MSVCVCVHVEGAGVARCSSNLREEFEEVRDYRARVAQAMK